MVPIHTKHSFDNIKLFAMQKQHLDKKETNQNILVDFLQNCRVHANRTSVLETSNMALHWYLAV